jgi:Ca2+-binding RTX toxin-like protein
VLTGLGGADFISGGNGADQIEAGAGADVVLGGNGNDTVNAGLGDDVVLGGNGADILNGGFGADFLFGGNGQDILNGGVGGDHLDGGDGRDILTGGLGQDFLEGGDGRDTFDFNSIFDSRPGALQRDHIIDFERGDRIDLRDIAGVDRQDVHIVHAGGNTFVNVDVSGGVAPEFVIQLDGNVNLHQSDILV